MSAPAPLRLEQGIRPNLKYDLPAGLVVFLVALPLCLGIALASNAPLFSGIIAGIIGGIVIGTLSGSSLSVSGPAAGLAVIVAQGISDLGSFDVFVVAVALSGLIQIVLGLLRLGVVGEFVPNSVIKGMLAAIGIVIFLKQVPHALGRDEGFIDELQLFEFIEPGNMFGDILLALETASWEAVLISLVSLGVMLAWDRPAIKDRAWSTYLPGPLVVVLLGVAINEGLRAAGLGYLSGEDGHLVSLPVVSSIGDLPSLSVRPDLSALTNPMVYTTAMIIAIVGSIETLLSVEASDRLDPFKRISNSNRELVAQGVGNTVSGLLGGLPITSVIVRSSTNVYSGGRTRVSAVFHGLLLLVSALAIPLLLNRIPLASLALILMVIGYKLARISLFQTMYRAGRSQFWPFISTVIAIVVTDLLTGIFIGLVIGFVFLLRGNVHEPISTVSDGEGNYLLRFTKDMSFVHKAALKKHLREIPNGSRVFIDGSRSMLIDRDVFETVEDFRRTAEFRDITVSTNNVEEKVFRRRGDRRHPPSP